MSVDVNKINRAIRECVRQTFGSNAQLADVEKYLDTLRLSPGWNKSEVRRVEERVYTAS